MSPANCEIHEGSETLSELIFTSIDTHAHVFTRNLKMIEGRRYSPSRDATLTDYLDTLNENGISHGVLVQISFLGS